MLAVSVVQLADYNGQNPVARTQLVMHLLVKRQGKGSKDSLSTDTSDNGPTTTVSFRAYEK